jgi:hypothetical protein
MMNDNRKPPTNPVYVVPTKALFREIQAMPVRDIKSKDQRELEGIRKALIRESCEVTRCVQWVDGITRLNAIKAHHKSKPKT